jgi:hypothetical protein
VVIAIGPERGKAGTVASVERTATSTRTHVVTDEGNEGWFEDRQNGLLSEDSPEAHALREAIVASWGPVDLDADRAFVQSAIAGKHDQIPTAIDRIMRHTEAAALDSLLDIVAFQVLAPGHLGKRPGYVAPSVRALLRQTSPARSAVVVERMRRWWQDERTRTVVVAVSELARVDPAILDAVRGLCADEPDVRLVSMRLAAEDETVYPDLARVRLVERDGQIELQAGGLAPAQATRLLAAGGERAARAVQLDIRTHGHAAYDGVDLGPWLAWPELARFRRLNLDSSFTGAEPLRALFASTYLCPQLEALDVSACDIGIDGCEVLGNAKALATLEELAIDRGDYDRTKWAASHLAKLFPKRGGALQRLHTLSIRGWSLRPAQVKKALEGRAPALRTVRLERDVVEL